jgi:hypothetical protein
VTFLAFEERLHRRTFLDCHNSLACRCCNRSFIGKSAFDVFLINWALLYIFPNDFYWLLWVKD